MSRPDTYENPAKENIQGVEIHLVKINNNGRKSDRASLGRTQKGGGAASPTDPEKGCAENQTIINVDRQINGSAMEKDMHERMAPDRP